jgi:hypothetical protein
MCNCLHAKFKKIKLAIHGERKEFNTEGE